MTRFLVGIATVIVLVAGCDVRPSAPLLTSDHNGESGCFLAQIHGRLTFDPDYGTRMTKVTGGFADSTPVVVWRRGFRAVQTSPGVVEVLDSQGRVVATTGTRYAIDGGTVDGSELHIPGIGSSLTLFWACGRVAEE